MLAFKTTTVQMPSTTGTTSIAGGFVDFESNVRTAHVALAGFGARFDNQHDHHYGELSIFFREVSISGRRVSFVPALLLRDFSENIDDKYSGFVNVLVIADLVPAVSGLEHASVSGIQIG